MNDPIVLGLVGQSLVIIGMLAKMLRDQLTTTRRRAEADEEHERLEAEITAAEERSRERVNALTAEVTRQRDRIHDQAQSFQAAVLRVAVMETRMESVVGSLVRVERLIEGLDRKVDALGRGAPS